MSRCRGFSLIEILLVMGIIGIIAGISVPAYMDYHERGTIVASTGTIADISLIMYQFKEVNGRFPDTLAEAGVAPRPDPWGQMIVYLVIEGHQENAGDARTDGFLKPLNADFDLYSIGKDGLTEKNIGKEDSQDDVVRGVDGAFIGRASEY